MNCLRPLLTTAVTVPVTVLKAISCSTVLLELPKAGVLTTAALLVLYSAPDTESMPGIVAEMFMSNCVLGVAFSITLATVYVPSNPVGANTPDPLQPEMVTVLPTS